MDYDRRSRDYVEKQIERISMSLVKLRSSENQPGRTIPDADDLVIGTGRRLPMAIMFLDICNYSSIPSETSSEQTKNLETLTIFFTEMVRIAEDYGGTVEKNTGDGLMAYFEDHGGQPPEAGCKRAIACALTMNKTNTVILTQILINAGIRPFEFRIAIDYGMITIARLGAARRFNSAVAIGTAANVANKMLKFGTESQIVIGESVLKRLPQQWQNQYTKKITDQTGWVYCLLNLPYPFYEYTGRWIN
jgi:class 3 adenylate cyclase